MKYTNPVFKLSNLHVVQDVLPEHHTMGNSLNRYCGIKIHNLIDSEEIKEIEVIGRFDRSSNISSREKSGKLFNFMRPTATIEGYKLTLECYPGQDYIVQFANVLNANFKLTGRSVEINLRYPSEENCWNELIKSGLNSIPEADVVILGYVEGFETLSSEKAWSGNGHFKWKTCDKINGNTILLGCEHTYWGDIAGRVVAMLAEKKVSTVIYSGKLGALNEKCIPNLTIATGSSSYLPGYGVVTWENLFSDVTHGSVFHGTHITMPSVLQETVEWNGKNKKKADFVDPEIGHMALSAQQNNIKFSYFHVVSDNLSVKFNTDLSNERNKEVLDDRKKLYALISSTLKGKIV